MGESPPGDRGRETAPFEEGEEALLTIRITRIWGDGTARVRVARGEGFAHYVCCSVDQLKPLPESERLVPRR